MPDTNNKDKNGFDILKPKLPEKEQEKDWKTYHNKIFGNNTETEIQDILWANKLYNRQDLQWYNKFNRFGALDPYNAISGVKEYLFFTKPDLHIVEPYTANINPELAAQPFFNELVENYPGVVSHLQASSRMGRSDLINSPFMNILSNSVKNILEIPAVSSTTVDTPSNIYGTSYNYRGWGFSSDEKVEFSLEFEDSKYLEIYHLVKAYEEYERLKHLGIVSPPNINSAEVDPNSQKCFSYYIQNKILHDQFSIYKFVVSDDFETIIYYAKLWGVFFKNVPRDTFSDLIVENGLKYAVEFEAAFIDDMNPTILADFNTIVRGGGSLDKTNYTDNTSDLPIYNSEKEMVEGRWAKIPVVVRVNQKDFKNSRAWDGATGMHHKYKLKWRV